MSGATGQGWHDPFPGRPYGGHDDSEACPFCYDNGTVEAHGDLHYCGSCDTWFDGDLTEVPAPEDDDE